MASMAVLRRQPSGPVGWIRKLREVYGPSRCRRLHNSLQQSLFNGTAEGYWKVLADPPTRFNFPRDVIDFWSTQERGASLSNPAFCFAVDDNPKADMNFSYTELSSLSKRVSGVLKDHLGLSKGDRLMVILPKTPEFWLIKLAALRCGIILTACTTMLTSKDIGLRLTKFAPHCVVAGEGQADAMDQVIGGFPGVRNKVVVSSSSGRSGWKSFCDLLKGAQEFEGVETLRDDPAFVFFTSGTTGPPKMVEHSQGYCLAHLATATCLYQVCKSDMLWCISDTGWALESFGTFPTWLTGACVFQARMPRFSAETTLSMLCDYPITKLSAPPTVYRALLQLDPSLFKFRSLNDCVSAGEPMHPETVLQWFDRTGLQVREGYGQTESVVLSASPVDKVKPGSMGLPAPNVTIQIHDDEGLELGPTEVGHIAVATTPRKPFGLFTCYR
ncbi:acyl-coenzyme A synthetase ACSM3, mitochondrial, partial [Ixodes scapularis]